MRENFEERLKKSYGKAMFKLYPNELWITLPSSNIKMIAGLMKKIRHG